MSHAKRATLCSIKQNWLAMLFKNIMMQGAQEPREEAYIACRLTKIAGQRRSWAFFNGLIVK